MSYTVRNFDSRSIAAPAGVANLQEWLKHKYDFLDVEIGCGTGWHPIRYALEHPDRHLIAFEHTRAKFERFSSRLNKHPALNTTGNLYAAHGEAMRWITHSLTEASVDRYFILYPNPEPKAPNKRWMLSPAMHRILYTLRNGAEIRMATNEEWYATEALDWAKQAWGLELVFERSLSATDLPNARTLFEKKYLARGETCFDLCWRKVRI